MLTFELIGAGFVVLFLVALVSGNAEAIARGHD